MTKKSMETQAREEHKHLQRNFNLDDDPCPKELKGLVEYHSFHELT